MSHQRFTDSLFDRVNVAPLVYFRIAFGLLLFGQFATYLVNDDVGKLWVEPDFHFTFLGFDWVQPWPEVGMYAHFVALAVLALMIAAGAFYRVSMTLFFLGLAYVFLVDRTYYLNHSYLLILISFLMIFVPAHRARSIDAWRRPTEIRSATAPAWTLWLLRFQIAVPYVYGGLAKIDSDWLSGHAMDVWLMGYHDVSVIGPLLAEPWAPQFFAWGGLVFDLLIVPLLLWKRTRWFAYVVALGFHVTNALLFNIAVFPWFMIAATLLFFPDDWRPFLKIAGTEAAEPDAETEEEAVAATRRKVVIALLSTWVIVQLLVPFRHHLYPGNVAWTEEGSNFSWRMKLGTKHGQSIFYAVQEETGRRIRIDPSRYLTMTQWQEMQVHPDMVVQFARHVAERMEPGYGDVEIHGIIAVSLNTRKRQLLVDPETDLSSLPRSLGHADWIMEFEETPMGELKEPWKTPSDED